MGYRIYTPAQITPATVTRKGLLEGETREIENPERVVVPSSTAIFYTPPDYDRFSADPQKRTVLLSDPAGTATIAEIKAAFPSILDAKEDQLWEAAHAWEQKFISGVGLSVLSLGVASGKPKALAVAQWSNNLWMNHYYPRKAAITLEGKIDDDFSAAGEMPYSVPELSAEVWG